MKLNISGFCRCSPAYMWLLKGQQIICLRWDNKIQFSPYLYKTIPSKFNATIIMIYSVIHLFCKSHQELYLKVITILELISFTYLLNG